MSVIVTSSLAISHKLGEVSLKFPDVRIDANEKILLLGQSGSGKSSFLSIIAGLLKPSTGSVHIHNQDLFAMSNRKRDLFRGKNFGFVFQDLHLVSSLTAEQNIKLTTDMLGIECNADKFDSLLTSLGLFEKIRHKPSELSQGEQQRVALARALIHSPSVVIADEPTSSLDDTNADQVMDIFESQCLATGATLIIATHDNRIKHRFDKVINIGA